MMEGVLKIDTNPADVFWPPIRYIAWLNNIQSLSSQRCRFIPFKASRERRYFP